MQINKSYSIYPSDGSNIVGGWSGSAPSMQNRTLFDATPFKTITMTFHLGTNTMSSVYTRETLEILNSSGAVISSAYKNITSNKDNGNYTLTLNISSIKQEVYIRTRYESNTPYGSDCHCNISSIILTT